LNQRRAAFIKRCLVIILLGGIAVFPVSTLRAVNWKIREYRLPLVVKTSEFLLRDYWYRRMAGEITHGIRGDEARLNALLGWTREHIRQIPPGWPIMDDHILYTIIRGYGVDEQQADVFVTLSSYARTPAFWAAVKPRPGVPERLILTFTQWRGRWTVWDVSRGIAFHKKDGTPATVSDLTADLSAVEPDVLKWKQQGRPYREYLQHGLPQFFVPPILRAQKQMPLLRLGFELRCLWARLTHRCYNGRELDPLVIFGEGGER